jgi:myo-inositol 2-dehydrogenase / D-chiro-inositol 1-dehydrogenase
MIVGVMGDGAWRAALAGHPGAVRKPGLDPLLRDSAVDAVVLDMPMAHRAGGVSQAVRAGKHVLVQGPLGRTAAEAEDALTTVKACGVKIAVVYNRNCNPAFQQVAAQLQGDKIGKPGFFKIHGDYPSPEVKGDGGLVLGDLIHELDWVSTELGGVKSVFAQGVKRGGKRPLEYAMITLTLRSGLIGQVIGSRRPGTTPRTRLEICGTAGMIQLDTGDEPIEIHTDTPRSVSPVANDAKHQQWVAFETLVASRGTGLAAARRSLTALRIAEAVQQSMDSGKPVSVGKG